MQWKDSHRVCAEPPLVTISSCLCDQTGAEGCNKAGVERAAANQQPDGPVPHATLRRREIVGKLTTVAFLNNPLDTNKGNSRCSLFNQGSIPSIPPQQCQFLIRSQALCHVSQRCLPQIFNFIHEDSSVIIDFVRVCEEPLERCALYCPLFTRRTSCGALFIDGCGALIRLKHTGLRSHLGVITGLGEGSRGFFPPFDYIH